MEDNKRTNPSQILLVVLLVAVFFVTGYFIGKVQPANSLENKGNIQLGLVSFFDELSNDLNLNQSKKIIDPTLIKDVYETIKKQYVTSEIDDSVLYEGAIKGMVEALNDEPTQYFTKDETENYKQSLRGDFQGIGAELGYYKGKIIVKRILENSPASKSSLEVGDLIDRVNDEEVKTGEELVIVVGKIRGPAGSEVKLNVTDIQQTKKKEIKITRGNIKSEAIEVKKLENDIGYIKLNRFTEETLEEFKANWDKSVDKLLNEKPKKIILDLRGNPGGYLVGAHYVAGEFLEKGKEVLFVKDREGISDTYVVDRSGRLINIPLIVLVDQNSASASEILAGAIKLNGRAKLLGTETYGKGSAQTVVEPKNWNGSSLHLTVQKWLLPDKSELTHEKPLQPDIRSEVNLEEIKNGKDTQLDEAIKYISELN